MNVPLKPLKSAPDRLIRAYREKEVRNGRVILWRLLTDDRMRTTWIELGRHAKDDREWFRIWRAIANAKHMSNRVSASRKSRTVESEEYADLARKLREMAKKVEGRPPLDVLGYELIPQDVWAALRVADFHQMDIQQRVDVAHNFLPCWPSASELLRGLEACAMNLSEEAMKKPRPDERRSGDVAARAFVWHLGREFHAILGQKLHGTLARIAEVTLDRKEELSRGFVQSALKDV